MSKITKHNYEAYLLDFSEGKLSKKDALALEHFLKENPELDADIFDTNAYRLTADSSVSFGNKLSLKRDEKMPEFNKRDSLLIGLLEDELDPEDKEAAEKLISEDDQALDEFELYRKTKLQADTDISFDGKNKLKKKTPVITLRSTAYASVAAAFTGLLAFGILHLNLLNNNQENISPAHLAQSSEIIQFDADKTNNTETGFAEKIRLESSADLQLASNDLPVAERKKPAKSTNKTSQVKHYEKEYIENLPRLKATPLRSTGFSAKDARMESRNVESISPGFPVNVTYVKNTSQNKIKFPEREDIAGAIDEIDEKYNPIRKLREAKDDILASNAKDLFRK
ncbi:MAG: hypothetical protein ACLFM1_02790 [Bacteroidales bacterium]